MSKASVILAALILGLGLGILLDSQAHGLTEAADIVGTLWLNGLRMTVVPLVVALLITGIAQTAAAARAGKLAGFGKAQRIDAVREGDDLSGQRAQGNTLFACARG